MDDDDFLSGGKGSYIFILRLDGTRRIRVGRAGTLRFARGHYAYVGSAFGPGGVRARLRHHATVSARPRWHLDYLRREATPREAWVSVQAARREHGWASILGRWEAIGGGIPGFGSSDCRCPTHLFHFRRRPRLDAFATLVRREFPDDPPIRRVPAVLLGSL